MMLRVRQGSTRQVLRVALTGSDGIGPMTGLRHDSPGLRAAFIRDGDTQPTELQLVPAEPARHTPGGWREIHPDLLPGIYELHAPDELFAGPGHGALLMIQAEGACPAVIHFDLVAYDPYDGERLGLACLSRDSRLGCLSEAFRDIVPRIIEEYQALSAGSGGLARQP